MPTAARNSARAAFAFAFAALAVSSNLRADEAAVTESRAWVLTDQRLVELDLESGSSLRFVPLGGGERLLSGEPSSPPLVRRVDGSLLWVGDADGAGLTPHDLADSVPDARFVVAAPGGRWLTISDQALAFAGGAGGRSPAQLLPKRAEVLATDGSRVWGLGSEGAFRLGRRLGIGSAEVEAPFDRSAMSTLAEPRAACYDPGDDVVLVADAQGLRIFTAAGEPVGSLSLEGITRLVCGAFGRVWGATDHELVLYRVLGGDLEVEQRRVLEAGEQIEALRADPRDFSPIVATGGLVVALGDESEPRWHWAADPGEAILDLEVSCCGPAGSRTRFAPRASAVPSVGSLLQPENETTSDELLVTGSVVLSETGNYETEYPGDPVGSAQVTAYGDGIWTTTSNPDGTFSLSTTPAGPSRSLDLTFQKQVGPYRLYSWPRSGSFSSGGSVWNIGDQGVHAACGVGFQGGLFPAGALNGDVKAMTVFDDGSGPKLYVAGTFTTAGGVTVNRVARWDGTSWSALGSGLTDTSSPSVNALVVFDDGAGPRLYAGGKFTKSGTTNVKYVAKWTGSAWTQVGAGLAAQVHALAVHDDGTGPKLFAGGTFTTANSVTYNRLAQWTGSSWVAVGGGVDNTVQALASFDDGTGAGLYVGGLFTQAGGSVSASRIAKWTGAGWTALGSGLTGGSSIQVKSLQPATAAGVPVLYVGGRFTSAGGSAAAHVAAWDGSGWSPLDTGLGVMVNALGVFDDGFGPRLYAAGSFTSVSGEAFNRIARWTGSYWEPLGTGLNGNALSLASGMVGGESSFFVGGSFGTADAQTSTRLARIVRQTVCLDEDAPRIFWVAPFDGASVASETPTLILGLFELASSGIDTNSLEIQKGGVPIEMVCQFSADSVECVPSASLGAGTVTLDAYISDLAGNRTYSAVSTTFTVAEVSPPSLSILDPTADAVLATPRPGLRFEYSDDGAGVDPDSLEVTANAVTLPLECQLAASSGLCVPRAPLANGPTTFSATIRDLQGNLSLPATVTVDIQAAVFAPTTIHGFARFEDGSPASGAGVSVADRPTLYVLAEANGAFTIPDVTLEEGLVLDLSARVTVSGASYLGFKGGIEPAPGASTDAGVVTLKRSCDGYFTSPGFDPAVPSFGANDLVTWDAGDGPRVFAGGSSEYAARGALRQIAQWGERGWEEVGGGVNHTLPPDVQALAVFDDGTGPAVYAGGTFTVAGGAPASYLAKWDGTQWREVGRGVNARVTGLAVYDDGSGPALYVAGDFTRVGTRESWTGTDVSITANHVAKWSGSAWSEVAGGHVFSGYYMTLRLDVLAEVSGSGLYLWEESGPAIRRLEGGAWLEVGPAGAFGQSQVTSATVGGIPYLFANLSPYGVWQRVGTTWTRIVADDLGVRSIVGFADASGSFLYASGTFGTLSQGYPEGLRRWDGVAWSEPLGDGGSVYVVSGLEAEPVLLRTSPFSRWDGSIWANYPVASDTEGSVTSIALLGDEPTPSVLFTGLTLAGGVALGGGIGRWDGTQVSSATEGLPGGTKVVQAFDGLRTRTYGLAEATGQVAEWNGSGWTPLGAALGVPIHDVDWVDMGSGMELYAGGEGLFRWNGTFWFSLGGPQVIETIEPFQNQLYVGGSFGPPGGGSTRNVQRWDGANWYTVGTASEPGPDRPVYSLKSFGSKLHLAGEFYGAGTLGIRRYGYMAWTGSAWDPGEGEDCGFLKNHHLSSSVAQTPVRADIFSLASFDDGRGAKLLLAGDYAAEFSVCSGGSYFGAVLPYRNLNLGTGADGPPVRALAVGRWAGAPAVALGGSFGEAGGSFAAKIAIFHPSPDWGSCSPAGYPPVITLTSPTNPWTSGPSILVAGSIDEPADLSVDGTPALLGTDRTFSVSVPLAEGRRTILLVAEDRKGMVTTQTLDVGRDSIAPQITVTSPSAGATVYATPMTIELAFSDGLSEIDLTSLTVSVGGAALPSGSCAVREGGARCTATVASGSVTIAATVRDLAGNLSAEAAVSVTVSPAAGGTTTQLSGRVELPSGVPASGARVRILGRAGVEGTSIADGTFSFPVAAVETDARWTVVAELSQGTTTLVAVAPQIAPVPGGTTDVGTLRLKASCDLAADSALFGEVGVAGRVHALAIFDDGSGPALYLAGSALKTINYIAHPILRWDGSRMNPLPNAPVGTIWALAVYDDGSGSKLYAGGGFSDTYISGPPLSGLARWTGAVWEDVGGGVELTWTLPGFTACYTDPGVVLSLLVFDDGSGPMLYVGGAFLAVGTGLPSDKVARWGPNGWTTYGPAPNCVVLPSPATYALATYDDGEGPAVYAGGSFSTIGGTSAMNIARLEGGSWQPLGWGLGAVSSSGDPVWSQVTSLAVFDSGQGPELIAAGVFNRAGDLTTEAPSIARWNGRQWAKLGEGLQVYRTSTETATGVQALAVFDDGTGPALYAAGSFTGATESAFTSIARWTGERWLPVGEGIADPSDGGMAMLVVGPRLYVGGGFASAGGLGVRGIAAWENRQWHPLGRGLDGAVRALQVWDDGTGPALYAGGDFLSYGEISLRHLGRWNGNSWAPLAGGTDGPVWALEVFDGGSGPRLFAGGRFLAAGGATAANIAEWNGETWSPLAEGVFKDSIWGNTATVFALESHDDGSGPALYAGGDFTDAGGVSRPGIARWRAGTWSGLGTGISGTVRALRSASVGGVSSLFVGGGFSSAGGVSAANIARWSGSAFVALGAGRNGTVESLEAWGGDRLLVGGSFVGYLSVWNGSAWSNPTGGTPAQTTSALTRWKEGSVDKLAAGGAFSSIGSVQADRLGLWDGTSWSMVGAGVGDGAVLALSAYEDSSGPGLFSGGSFTTAGGSDSSFLARWYRPLTCGDTTPPIINIVEPLAGIVTTSTPTLVATYSDAASSVDPGTLAWLLDGQAFATDCTTTLDQATCIPTSPLPEGAAGLAARVADLSGNVGTSTAVEIVVDSVPPTVTITSPSEGALLLTSEPTITAVFSDAGTGVDAETAALSLEGPAGSMQCSANEEGAQCTTVLPLADGSWAAGLSVRDFSGQLGEATVAFVVDTAPPTIQLTSPAPGGVTNDATPELEFSYSDLGAGVATGTFVASLDGGATSITCAVATSTAQCTPTTPLAEGAHVVAASIEDGAGRSASTGISPFEVLLDFQAPVLTVSSPATSGYTAQTQATVAGTVSESASVTVNGLPAEVFPDLSFVSSSVMLAEGQNTLVIVASDPSGNSSQVVRTLTRDTTAPSLVFTTPEPGSVVDLTSSSVLVSVVETGSGLAPASVTFTANGSAVISSCSTTPTTLTCTLSDVPGGNTTLIVTALDQVGNASAPASVTFLSTAGLDLMPPVLVLESPAPNSTVAAATQTLRGRVSEPSTVALNGTPATVNGVLQFTTEPVTLDEGTNSFLLQAVDLAGNLASLEFELTLDSSTPPPLVEALVSTSEIAVGSHLVTGVAGAVPEVAGVHVAVRSQLTGERWDLAPLSDGSFSGAIVGFPGDRLLLSCVDAAGNESPPIAQVLGGSFPSIPDPASVAPRTDPALPTPFCAASSFLWAGAGRLQFGAVGSAIDCSRLVLLRGRVRNASGAPIDGALVTVVGQPEVGRTFTRSDGVFDLAVNGGDTLTVRFAKSGYLPIERSVGTRWGTWADSPDVVLTPQSAQATSLEFDSSESFQAARGEAVTDVAGSRQATALLLEGTTAQLVLPGGSQQPLAVGTVRATEYTVGAGFLESLPAEAPSEVSVAYAVELSVDEASAAGATKVEFSRDLPFLVENFLNFPIGTTVPAAYLDRSTGTWVASNNGRVIELLSESAGLADLDLNGSGIPATPAELVAFGVSDEERAGLASLYEPGQELWRVPVRHFTPWLLGWPYLVASQSKLPPFQLPSTESQDDLDRPAMSRFAGTIEVDNQILGQTLDLVGTSQGLHYRSDRVPGRKAPYLLTIPLSEEILPPNLLRIDIDVNIAGQTIRQSFAPQASQVHQVEWDGLDRFGRSVQGREPWTVAVSYVYPSNFAVPDSGNPAFGRVGGIRMAGVPGRQEVRFSRETEGTMGALQATTAFGLGGWSLTSHHVLDLETAVLYYGDGRRRQLRDGRQEPAVAKRIAGTGQPGFSADGGPADKSPLGNPTGLSVMRDGSLLIAESGYCRIRKVAVDGIVTTVAGSECVLPVGDVGDGQPATFANLLDPLKAIEGPDGRIYIADQAHHRVRRVLEDGTIETIAGNGQAGCPAPDALATMAPVQLPTDLSFDLDGNLLILMTDKPGLADHCEGVRRLNSEGRLELVVDESSSECEDANCSHTSRFPAGIATGPDGSLYIADSNAIERRPAAGRNPDETPWVIAGLNRLYGPNDHDYFAGDGLEASWENTRFNDPKQVALGIDGAIYVADRLNARVRVIGPDNMVSTALGGGPFVPGSGQLPASQVALAQANGVALSPDGQYLYVSDLVTGSVYRVGLPEIQGESEKYVPSEDGSALYVFDAEGRHLRTEDSVTRRALLTFRYTAYPVPGGDPPETKLLTEIEDSFGNITGIERSETGEPERIVGPFGAATELELHPTTGFLRYVRRHLQAGIEQVEITTSGEGLIEALEDPKSHTYTYQWDTEGRLHRVLDPESGEITLDFTKTLTGHRVTQTTAEGRVSSTEVEFLPMGEIRQTVTLPTGHEIEALRKRDGSLEWTYPDDTVAVSEAAPEPRLGPLVKLSKKSTVTTPEDGLVLERTFERSVSGWVGDPLGLAQQTDTTTVNGRVSTREYSAFDRILRTTSPEGRTTEVEFDTFGRLAEARQPNTEAVRVSYDPKGRVETVAQGQGALERKVQYAYNTEGHLDSVTDPLGEVVTFEYDAVGRVTKTILPDQREIRYEYDLNGNLVKLRPPTRPDHAFDHNAVDQVSEYAPPDLDPGTPEIPATTYAYNDDHQLTTITRPDGLMVSLAYETSGRLDGLTAPHGTIDYAYDAESGKLATITAPDGPTVSYDYDGPWLQQVTVGGPFSSSIQLEADRPFTGQPDTNFWLGKLRINDDPATEIDYEYDDDGLPTKIGDLEMYYESETSRLVGTELFQTGDRVTRNSFGEMERYEAGFQEVPGGGSPPLVGTKLLDSTYQRDKLGRIERKVETSRATPASSPVTHVYEYEYDPERGWLEEVTLDGIPVETYAYDANGNRTSWSTSFGSGTATYDDQDRLLTYGLYTYTYTANGELLTKSNGGATTTYGYDVFGNLRTVTLPDGIEIEYLIDGRNRRIGKKVNGTLVQRFLYLGGLSPIAELDAAGNVTTQYLYGRGGNVPDGFVRGGVTYRILTDHLGSVRHVLDAQTGDVVQRMEYDAYGRVILDTNPGFQPLAFAGGLYDYQTGLTRFGARDYDPEIGRWTSKDPIGFGGGSTGLYEYVGNDPLNLIDPSGLYWSCGPDCQERLAVNGAYRDAIATGLTAIPGIGSAAAFLGDSLIGQFLPRSMNEMHQAVEGGLLAIGGPLSVTANAAKGAAFEAKVIAEELTKRQRGIVQQLLVETPSGVRTRLDAAARALETDAVALSEMKSSATAPLTRNQTAAFPEIAEKGAIVVGKGRPGFPGGTILPPTEVEIIRPETLGGP